MKTIIENLNQYQAKIDSLLEELRIYIIDKIQNCKSPDINIISENPRIFTLKFSNIKDWNISAEYYDIQYQINQIKRSLAIRNNINDIKKFIVNMIADKSLIYNKQKYILHENLIELLKNILVEFK